MAKEVATKFETSPKFIWTMRLLAFILLVIAGYLLLMGDSAGGAVAGAIAFGLALFHYVPLVTEVSGFGVTAKLEREVMQAEEILEQIRRFTSAYARSTFHQLAWMNRMGAPSERASRDLVSSLDGLMASIGVSVADQRQAKRPYLMMIGFDLILTIRGLISRYSSGQIAEINGQIEAYVKNKPAAMDDPVVKELHDRKARLALKEKAPHPEDYDKIENLGSYLSGLVDELGISGDDKSKILNEIDKASRIFSECFESGNKSTEAEHFIATGGDGKDYYERIFVQKPAA